jgi:hypothetical protein
MSRTVSSPDGRTWKLDRVRPDSPLRLTRKEPFFWPSVVATLFLVAFAGRMIWVDPGPLTLSIVVPLLAIWFLERGLHFFRPVIRARTDGPPAETLTWRATPLVGVGRIERRIVKAIESGRPESEPSGALLIGI